MVGGLRCRCHRSVWAEDWQCAPSAVPAHEAAEGAAAAAAVEAAAAVAVPAAAVISLPPPSGLSGLPPLPTGVNPSESTADGDFLSSAPSRGIATIGVVSGV